MKCKDYGIDNLDEFCLCDGCLEKEKAMDISFVETNDLFEDKPDFTVRYAKHAGIKVSMQIQQEYVRDSIEWLEANPKEFSTWTTTGDCFVFVHRESDSQKSKYRYSVYFMEIKYHGFAGND